jgi:hypothetical protein
VCAGRHFRRRMLCGGGRGSSVWGGRATSTVLGDGEPCSNVRGAAAARGEVGRREGQRLSL